MLISLFILHPNKNAYIGGLGLDSVSQVTQGIPLLALSPTKKCIIIKKYRKLGLHQ